MTLEEIKLRRLAGQHLADKSDAATVLHDLCGIQAQMMSYAEHSLGIRCIDAPGDIDGFSAKSWTLRGTMHIFALDDLPLFLHDGRRIICANATCSARTGTSAPSASNILPTPY